MDVIDYCLGLEHELSGWKQKLDDLRRIIQETDHRERDAMLTDLQALTGFFDRMSARLDELKAECPTRFPEDRAAPANAPDPTAKTAR